MGSGSLFILLKVSLKIGPTLAALVETNSRKCSPFF